MLQLLLDFEEQLSKTVSPEISQMETTKIVNMALAKAVHFYYSNIVSSSQRGWASLVFRQTYKFGWPLFLVSSLFF
jgi:hypothetical protein